MILEVKGLAKSFGGLLAVDDVSFQIEEKELCAIIGPNGAGKTTLFNLLTGEIPPDSGRIIFKGRDITKLPSHTICRGGVARSFQRLNIFPRLSAFESVQVALFSAQRKSGNLFSRTEKMAREETEEILESVGLYDKQEVRAAFLAHGDQKRLELAIALASRPELLLLDEPTAGMSPRETREAVELIRKQVKVRGLSLIFVEHDMSVVFGIADNIKVMYQGRMIFQGKPEEARVHDKVQSIYLGGAKI
jgi:branched-chain amino acid transport system ATP-binding protein